MEIARGAWASLMAIVVASGSASAQSEPSAAEPPSAAEIADRIEAQIRADVERSSGPAALLFDEADDARASGQFERALELYQQVIRLAPQLDHPRRRACSALVQLDRFHEAVTACEDALERGPDSPFNQISLAQALAMRNGPGDRDRALDLARRGTQSSADPGSLVVWCQVALMLGRLDEARACADQLAAADRTGIEANSVRATLAALEGDAGRARKHLETARQAGMPEDQYRRQAAGLHGLLAATRPDDEEGASASGWAASLFTALLAVAGGWLAGLLVLLAAGWLLSRLTLRAADRVAASGEAHGDGSPQERRLRRIYKVVVLLCGAYFYVSVPLLVASALVAGGAIIWAMLSVGYISIKLVFVAGLLVFVTIGAVVRGLFFRAGEAELGHRIDDSHPRFRQLLDDVARVMKTRPVDAAYLTPQTSMAVLERGGLWRSLSGRRAQRCLIVGAGLLDGMRQIELRSVLAHEYGHFRNQDTAGGGFALAVRRSLFAILIRLAQSGGAAWYNPAWSFLRAYHRVYLIVSQGASRLQEVLADRWAIRAYGSEAFIRGYTHVVERSIRFDQHVQRTLTEVIEHQHRLPNLYRYEPAEPAAASQADPADGEAELIRAEMEREPSGYDSHPSPRQRLTWAELMKVDREPALDDGLPVWDLFDDREELEKRMTAEIREATAQNHGIAIAG